MSGHSLLRRIREPSLAAPRRTVSAAEVRSAVLEHLRALFQTRAGSALVAADYGIVSVTDIVHSCPDAIEDILKSIRHSIRTYEPRLLNVVVKHITGRETGDTLIAFEISADVFEDGKRVPIKLQTTIDASRKVIVT